MKEATGKGKGTASKNYKMWLRITAKIKKASYACYKRGNG